VDDTPANLGVLFEILSTAGFDVLVAEDGTSAIQRAAYAQPGLILLDVLMPDKDGFATCTELKVRPDTQHIPVIFMTALTETAHKVHGLRLGAVDYITKPFQAEEVLARVTSQLTLHQLQTQLRESEERLLRMVDSAMDAIITLDPHGQITLFNPAAERIFRCPAIATLGRPVADFLSGELRQVLADDMQQGKQPPASPEARWLPEGLTAVRANGETFPIEGTLSRTEAAGHMLYTLILRDVQERHQADAERRTLQGLTQYLADEVRAAHQAEDLVGDSPALRQVMQLVERVASTDATVLLTGETGTGKELIARALHQRSQRQAKPLVKLNCATLPAGVVESELFGHEKGAFTGALSRQLGRFELADGGTLFLDEIGELPLELQAKLLRVLQEGEFERVGGTRTLRTDVRIIAATNRDLAQAVQQGQFRSDLFYRINVFPIHLPPLRERPKDIPPLVTHFVRKYAAKFSKSLPTVSAQDMDTLCTYAWPGNVRELQHVIERAVILSTGPYLELGTWFSPSATGSKPTRVATLEETERTHILAVLERTGWRVSGTQGAAELLGLRPTTLESRMKKLGMTRPA
jgi:PAS domain S-box-containing protein